MPHTEAFKTNRQGAIISIEDIDKGEEKAQDLTIMKQNQDKSSRKTNKKMFLLFIFLSCICKCPGNVHENYKLKLLHGFCDACGIRGSGRKMFSFYCMHFCIV